MAYPSRGAWAFSNLTKATTFWPRLASLSITMEHPEGLANLDCDVVDEDASQDFDVEDHVIATFRGERIFAGHLKLVTEDQADEFGPRIWTLSAQDYTAKLDDAIIRRRTPRKRERVKRRVRWILSYMRSNIWSLSGKDLDGMPAGNPFVEEYDYHGDTVREALDQVAEETRLNFYVDFENVAHVFRNEVFDSPFDLDNDGPDYSTSFPFRVWSHSLESTDLGNAVLVEPEQRKESRWSRDATSIAAYGRQERFVGDSALGGPIAASNVGERTLAGIKDPEVGATLECWEPGLLPGQRVDVTEGLWGHVAERFWIRRVVVTAPDPHDAAGEAYLRSEVTISDRLNPTLRRSGRGGGGTPTTPGTTVDTGDHPLTDLPDDASPPSVSDGSSAGSFGVAGQVRANRIFDGGASTYTENDFSWHAGLAAAVYMGYGFSHPHTSKPSFTACTGLDYAMAGYALREQWFDMTVGTHPSNAAGMRVTILLNQEKGYGATAGANVMVRSAQPDGVGQGTLVATVPYGVSTDVVIPYDLIPAEGGTLYLGLLPAWVATPVENLYAYYCGWPSPSGSESYQLDSTGAPWQGYSGEVGWATPASATWTVYAAASPDLGNIEVPADDDTPWEGGNTIGDSGYEGDGGAWSISGGKLTVDASTPSGKGINVGGSRSVDDDSEPWGPWSDLGWAHEFHFTVSAHGSTSDPGRREIQSTTSGEGEQAIGTVHLGDSYWAEGISVSSPSATVFLAKALTLDEEWVAKFDTRSGKYVRGKIWRAADGEPAAWDVQVELDETSDEQDRWDLWVRAGNDGTSQAASAYGIRAAVAGVSGQQVIYEVLGHAGGERTFDVAHRFRRDEIRPYVNGIASEPLSVRPDEAEFTLDFPPTPDSIVAASYVIA